MESLQQTVDLAQPTSDDIKTKVAEAMAFVKSQGWEPARQEPQPQSWFVDPYQLLDSAGLGYRQSPGIITYDTLLQMTERDPVVAAIIQTRIMQVASFARPQVNKYSIGFVIRLRDRRKRKLDQEEKEKIDYLEKFLLNTGHKYSKTRDTFEVFIKKFVRDSMTWDQATFEKVRGLRLESSKPGKLLSFFSTPSASMRVANPRNRRGTPPDENEARKAIQYCQVVNGKIVTDYREDQLAFCVRNPRSNIDAYKYGYTELEMLLNTITAHLWAEEWNRKAFSNGSTIKGLMNIKGNVPTAQLESFKRQWWTQVTGVSNAHRTPIMNADGVEWFPLQLSNTEMGYQMWLEYLIKVATAVFLIDPAEINFDLRGGAGVSQPMFMTTNEAQQKVSRDRGLRPLLRFVADSINRHIIWELDDRFEFDFVGLDAKTEESAVELRLKEVTNYKTINEVRLEDDLPPIEGGDVILNPTFTGYLFQKQSQQQQGGAPGGAPDASGGQPGGAPPMGAPGGDPSQQQPQMVEHRPNALMSGNQSKKPGKEEDSAARAINQKAEESSEASGEESSSKTGPDLTSEDWESTIHASLRDPSLKKSARSFDFSDIFIDVSSKG